MKRTGRGTTALRAAPFFVFFTRVSEPLNNTRKSKKTQYAIHSIIMVLCVSVYSLFFFFACTNIYIYIFVLPLFSLAPR